MSRCESLLRRSLQDFGINISIESNIIFINPEFTLFQAPLNLPIILPTQLNRFMKKLNMVTSKLNEKHIKLAEHLVSEHKNESIYTKLPEYDYQQLNKGITCTSCNSFLSPFSYKELVCDECGCKDNLESAVMRSVEEFSLLFPEKKITTSTTHEWCKVIDSKKAIRRILMRNLILFNHRRFSYFVFRNQDS